MILKASVVGFLGALGSNSSCSLWVRSLLVLSESTLCDFLSSSVMMLSVSSLFCAFLS